MPPHSAIRARGFVAVSPSSWLVETTRPALTGARIASRQFEFNIIGNAGQIVALEGSTDLLNWTALATNTIANGPLFFTDAGSTTLAWRFYRARSP